VGPKLRKEYEHPYFYKIKDMDREITIFHKKKPKMILDFQNFSNILDGHT